MPYGLIQKRALIVISLAVLSSSALLAQVVRANHVDIDTYIHESWKSLERSTNDCDSVVDPKVTSKPVIYIPAGSAISEMLLGMQSRCGVEVQHLPKVIRRLGDLRPEARMRPGLLYLPNPYVVPGGRFNEMYGWDSYFIILGLLSDGRTPTAKGMVENFFFEIANYGAVLNANRTYFLTRSQPPLLSSMIAEVYGTTHDLKWLASAYRYAQSDYALWTSVDHQAGTTGLSRYFDLGTGPVPEMADDSTYYPDVIRWMVAHPQQHGDYLIAASPHPGQDEALRLRSASCDVSSSRVCSEAYADGFRLSFAFYKGDRAMRESGFDTSFRFGPFSGSTDHFAPVCLNSLLYKYERDMAAFASLLGKQAEARLWLRRAATRRRAIGRYLWNPDIGTFSDYNFVDHRASTYRFATEFYPLWAGLATSEQAKRIASQLPTFEREGGLAMSNSDSGTQWDSPFGWAPAQWFAIEGLRRYGFLDASTRLAQKFRHTVDTNYLHDGTIREKYNVVDGSANIAVSAGYKTNVIGFGWTNGVYEKLARFVLETRASDSRSENDTLQEQPRASKESKTSFSSH
ncbi:trehalase family glycosidase [Granulicella sp. L60]|uniref:trehalase family glycosidase n=1 Tax=Granulicella sp. L60 TaxID=1641866 RepID=UPI00131B88ED|nr:trehalase family glycosidase [Granulicella sp. L60]